MKAKPLMVQGTMSNAGKSLTVTAVCRVLARQGYRVAPFKSQNMALNSFVTKEGAEIGRAQAAQAEACKKEADVRMNPVLLKPTTDMGSQVIVLGKSVGNYTAREYFSFKKSLKGKILQAYESLAAENDVIVIEGAGSPVELNLNGDDIVNMGLARMVSAPVLLVGDIDRGGIFAQLCGTLSLLSPKDRERVRGILVNKFRGDLSLFDEGRKLLQRLAGKPVLGVLPYTKIDIDDEDSLSERLKNKRGGGTDIAVIRLPKLSNFTDFSPFGRARGCAVRYVERAEEFGSPDLVILPGTKSTIEDLRFLKRSGLAEQVVAAAHRGIPVFGVCGGFQMLGKSVEDPLGVEGGGREDGLGLLPVSTVFDGEKCLRETQGVIRGLSGIFSCLNGKKFSGYEIHMGRSGTDSAVIGAGNVYGTYVHGIFDEAEICQSILRALGGDAGELSDARAVREQNYELLADVFEQNTDVSALKKIIEEGA